VPALAGMMRGAGSGSVYGIRINGMAATDCASHVVVRAISG
jgi:hypothetical protein